MNRLSLASAAAIILIANAFALVHSARNRFGAPDADVTLTQRELTYYNYAVSDENSGVALNLNWVHAAYFNTGDTSLKWLDQTMLQKLGFDCSVKPDSDRALRFYERQRPRQVYVAMEYDGAAWRNWRDDYVRGLEEQQARNGFRASGNPTEDRSHLIPIDADLDVGALRVRHPERASVIILPAAIRIGIHPYPLPEMNADVKRSLHLSGEIESVQTSIHVPRPLSDEFRRLEPSARRGATGFSYRVHLRYGALHEPWVTSVEFTH